MKKLSLFLALAMILTISGVYAVWTFAESTDIMDINTSSLMDMGEATTIGTYGTYKFTNNLKMVIDPKVGTNHTTALYVTGSITITFTPNVYAPADIVANGVESYFSHEAVSESTPTYLGTTILTVDNNRHTIHTTNSTEEGLKWTKDESTGVFSITFSAEDIAEHIHLAEIDLESKTEYDNYDAVLSKVQIKFHISDGNTGSGSEPQPVNN